MTIKGRGAIIALALIAVFAIGISTNVIQIGIPLQAQETSLGYASCSFAGFLPSVDNVGYRSNTPPGSTTPQADYRPLDALFGGTVLCPIQLPHGANMLRANFDFFSSTATGLSARVDCFLKREQIVNTFLTPQSVNIGQAQSTPVLGRTTVSAVISPNDSLVDNANFAYYLSCSIPSNETDVGIVGGNVEYSE